MVYLLENCWQLMVSDDDDSYIVCSGFFVQLQEFFVVRRRIYKLSLGEILQNGAGRMNREDLWLGKHLLETRDRLKV